MKNTRNLARAALADVSLNALGFAKGRWGVARIITWNENVEFFSFKRNSEIHEYVYKFKR